MATATTTPSPTTTATVPDHHVAGPGDWFPAMDGLRGAAVLVVVGAHANVPYFVAGNLAVDVFFVLSGFLITKTLLDEWRRHGSVDPVRFYARRLLRLWPALLVLIGVTALAVQTGLLVQSAGAASSGSVALVSGLFVGNIAVAVDDPFLGIAKHFWSLGVEEQFYLVWPIAVALLVRTRRPWRWTAGAAVVSGVLLCVVSAGSYQAQVAAYVLPVTHGSGLLLGCGLALAGPTAWRAAARWSVPCALALALLIAFLSPVEAVARCAGILLASALAVPLVASCATGRTDVLTRLLSRPALRAIGKRSYGLYIWHFVLITGLPPAYPGLDREVAVALAVALAFVASWVSYRFVELPFLRQKHRFH